MAGGACGRPPSVVPTSATGCRAVCKCSEHGSYASVAGSPAYTVVGHIHWRREWRCERREWRWRWGGIHDSLQVNQALSSKSKLKPLDISTLITQHSTLKTSDRRVSPNLSAEPIRLLVEVIHLLAYSPISCPLAELPYFRSASLSERIFGRRGGSADVRHEPISRACSPISWAYVPRLLAY